MTRVIDDEFNPTPEQMKYLRSRGDGQADGQWRPTRYRLTGWHEDNDACERIDDDGPWVDYEEAAAEVDRLRARVAELEAERAAVARELREHEAQARDNGCLYSANRMGDAATRLER